MQSLEEMRAYFEGNPAPGTKVHHLEPKPSPVYDARKKLVLTQVEFAAVLGISVSAVRKWEQEQRMPGGAVRMLLRLIDSHPDIVKSALASSLVSDERPLVAAQ
jgi:putative transcriptional regulator